MVKNPPANAGEMGSSPGPGRSHVKKKKKKMAPKHSGEALSSVPKRKKAVMCLTEKICVKRKASLKHELQCCWL